MNTDLTKYPDYMEWLSDKGYLDGYRVKVCAKIFGIDGKLYDVDTIGYVQKEPELDVHNRAYVAFLTGYGPISKDRFTLCGASISIEKLLNNVVEYPRDDEIKVTVHTGPSKHRVRVAKRRNNA